MIIAETQRLLIRHFHYGDAQAMEQVLCDAEVMRFGSGVQSPEWVQEWLGRCLVNYHHRWGFGLWAVVDKNAREVLGYCGLTYFPEIDGQSEVEIGYRLSRHSWGRGYATEAAVAVRDYAFDILCLPRLIALIDPSNIASIRVAEKIGMKYEKDVMRPGYTHPDHVYALPRS